MFTFIDISSAPNLSGGSLNLIAPSSSVVKFLAHFSLYLVFSPLIVISSSDAGLPSG